METYNTQMYFAFDAHMQWWLMGKGAEAYIPLRHYGEHGSQPQHEHLAAGIGRGGEHHADNLVAPLAFLPAYAAGSRRRYLITRAVSRLYGLARLISGRWIVRTHVYDLSIIDLLKMHIIGLRRLLKFGTRD
jgi:hypothetical protein